MQLVFTMFLDYPFLIFKFTVEPPPPEYKKGGVQMFCSLRSHNVPSLSNTWRRPCYLTQLTSSVSEIQRKNVSLHVLLTFTVHLILLLNRLIRVDEGIALALPNVSLILLTCTLWHIRNHIQDGPKTGSLCFARLKFVKYWPIFKLISLSESGEHL